MVLPWPHIPVTLSMKPQQFHLAAQQHQLAQVKGTVLSSPCQSFLALPLFASAIARAGGDQLSNAMTISIRARLGTRQPTAATCQSGCKGQHVQQDQPFGCNTTPNWIKPAMTVLLSISQVTHLLRSLICVFLLPLLAFLQTTTFVRLQ